MRAMSRNPAWLVMILAASFGTACEEEKPKQDPEAEQPRKPRAEQGQPCQSNEDCADGLGCSKDKKCETYKTIDCQSREQTCKGEGRCTGRDNRCVAGSNEDCQKSTKCKTDGECSEQDGRCVAATTQDCEKLCQVHGRCTVEDGNCVAASNDDCKESAACKTADRCVAKLGRCISNK